MCHIPVDDIALDIALLELNRSDDERDTSEENPAIIKVLSFVVYGIVFLVLVSFGWMITKRLLAFE
jgi:hypothetical protein